MTPGERWREATRLYWTARRLRTAYERQVHPEWTDDQVALNVRNVFLRAGT